MAPPLPALLLLLTCPSLVPALPTFPSCLSANTTWDPAYVTGLTPNVASPELCQQICVADITCQGFTWLTSDVHPTLPSTCATFSATETELPCTQCVSGGRICTCSRPGECVAEDDNIVEVHTGIASEEECNGLCNEESRCMTYTYFGENNDFRHMCILYSSCDQFSTTCEDCITGIPNDDCNVCSFEFTMQDGSCALMYADDEFNYLKIEVASGLRLEEGQVADTCEAAGLRAVCVGPDGCSYTDTTRCVVTPLSSVCSNPMYTLSKVLCDGASPRACPALEGLFSYTKDRSGGECGAVGGNWCVNGNDYVSGNPPYFAYCAKEI